MNPQGQECLQEKGSQPSEVGRTNTETVDEAPAGSVGFGGTVGKRSASTSAARAGPACSGVICRSSALVTTSTSSSLLRLAAGFTRTLRKRSLPVETFVTFPIGRPLGK